MMAQMLRDWMDNPKLMFRLENALGVAGRRLGDRITVHDTSIMVNGTDAFVTAISFTYTNKGWFQTLEAVEAASIFSYGASDYFIIGTSIIALKVVFY